MSALPPSADMCSALAHVCFGPKADISEQTPKLSYLFFVGRAASPRTCRRCQDHLHYRTHGKHAREMLVEDSHRYHSISHGWGPLIIRTTGKMPSRPSPRASEGGRFKAISPGMLPPALSSANFVAFTGRFIHGNEVSPGNLCREPAAVA